MAYYHKPATSSGDEELALNENRSDLPFQLISITPQPPPVSLSSLDPTTLTFAGLDYHPAPLQSPSPLPMPVLNYETQKSTTTHFDEPDSPQKTYTQRPTLGLPRQSSNSHHLNRRHHWLPKLALILVLLLQSLIVIGFFASVYIYLDGRVSTDGNVEYRTILAYLLIFIIATIFSVVIAMDSILNKNVAQLLALCIFNISMGVYGGILPRQIDHTVKDSLNEDEVPDHVLNSIHWRLILVPALTGLFSLILLGLTWHFYLEFGWEIYKQFGADIKLRKAVRTNYIFFMLQKFNLFFLVGFCIQTVLFHGDDLETRDIVLPVVALFASCCVILFATIAVDHELKSIMALYYIVWILAMTFLCYEITRIYPRALRTNNQHSFLLFASLTLGMLLSTGICSIPCWLNFGKGLKECRVRSPWLALVTRRNTKEHCDEDEVNESAARPTLD